MDSSYSIFNLAKCPDASNEIQQRDKNYYISHSMSTLSLPYNMVIYCDEESVELIKSCRPDYLSSKTSLPNENNIEAKNILKLLSLS